MSTKPYAEFPVFVSGNQLSEKTSVSLRLEGGWQPVRTMDQALAGFTRGSGNVTVRVESSVPATGTEFDFWNNCANGTAIDIQVGAGPQSYASRGILMNVELSKSADQPAQVSFEWNGPPDLME